MYVCMYVCVCIVAIARFHLCTSIHSFCRELRPAPGSSSSSSAIIYG